MSGKNTIYRRSDENFENIINGIGFSNDIYTSSDFPDINVHVRQGHHIKSYVVDNDPTKTNTNQTFYNGDVIYWNGEKWIILGNELEENPTLQKLNDLHSTNHDLIYVGYAPIGASTTDNAWKVKRVDDSSLPTKIVKYANNGDFKCKWTERETLTYN